MSTEHVPVLLFPLGRIVATSNAVSQLTERDIHNAINRHSRADWGELCEDDRSANNRALADGGRLLSVYRSSVGIKFYVITETDRSATTVLLPEDY